MAYTKEAFDTLLDSTSCEPRQTGQSKRPPILRARRESSGARVALAGALALEALENRKLRGGCHCVHVHGIAG